MLIQVSKSTTLPLSVAEAKAHLRVDHSTDDTYIESLIRATQRLIECETNLDLSETTYDIVLPGWYQEIHLPRAPLASVTSVKYYTGTTQQTLSNTAYRVITPTFTLGYIEPVTYWPSLLFAYGRSDAVTVRFVTGSIVPETAKHALRLLVGHWYETREAVVTGTIATELPLGFQRLVDNLSIVTGFGGDN